MSAAVAIARLILSGGESPLGVLLLAEVCQEPLPPGARARCPKRSALLRAPSDKQVSAVVNHWAACGSN